MAKARKFHVSFKDNLTVKSAENYIKMVAMGDLQGCILLGPPGMGKTHTVKHILEKNKVEYVSYGGHISLAQTYKYLWENHDKIIFMDDVSQVVNKVEIIEMLKQALNVNNGQRILHYRSTNVLSEDVPKSFEFTGRIIFAFNLIDSQNPNVKAIMDRAPVVELRFNRIEILEAMYEIANSLESDNDLRINEKVMITKEIEDYTDASMDISFRKQALAFNIYSAFKKMYGVGNTEWIGEVHRLFGKKQRHWVEELMMDTVGLKGSMERAELVKLIITTKQCSLRNAQKNISDVIEAGILHTNSLRKGLVSLTPFK